MAARIGAGPWPLGLPDTGSRKNTEPEQGLIHGWPALKGQRDTRDTCTPFLFLSGLLVVMEIQ